MRPEPSRLILREFETGDVEDVHAYSSDYETVRHMMFGPNTPEQTRAYLQEQCPRERDETPRAFPTCAQARCAACSRPQPRAM